MKSRVVAVKTAPNKISIEFQNGTVWEYEKGEVSYTEWTLGKPTDWFIPNELDFLKKINRYIEEAIMLKTVEKNAAEFWQKSAIQSYKNGVSYMTIGRRCGKSQVAAQIAKSSYNRLLNTTAKGLTGIMNEYQTLTNRTLTGLTPKKSKSYLIVFPDDVTYIRKGPYLYTNVPNYKPNRIHQVNLSYPNQFKKFRGMQFDHVLFINCDETFLPPELTCTMHYAKITYCK